MEGAHGKGFWLLCRAGNSTHDGYDWNIGFGIPFLYCITIPLIFFSLLSKHRTKEDYIIIANMANISTIRIFSSAIWTFY
jgi:hypothetical protein